MQKWSVVILLVLSVLTCGFVFLIGLTAEGEVAQRRAFAIAMMVTGLLVIWVGICGGLMFRLRV